MNKYIAAEDDMPKIVMKSSNMSTDEILFIIVTNEVNELKKSMLNTNVMILIGNITRFLLINVTVGLWGILWIEPTSVKNTTMVNMKMMNCTP